MTDRYFAFSVAAVSLEVVDVVEMPAPRQHPTDAVRVIDSLSDGLTSSPVIVIHDGTKYEQRVSVYHVGLCTVAYVLSFGCLMQLLPAPLLQRQPKH
jgi:hypothetical protein